MRESSCQLAIPIAEIWLIQSDPAVLHAIAAAQQQAECSECRCKPRCHAKIHVCTKRSKSIAIWNLCSYSWVADASPLGRSQPWRTTWGSRSTMHTFRRNALHTALLLSGCLLVAPDLALAAVGNTPTPASTDAQSSSGTQSSQDSTTQKAKGVKQLNAVLVTGNTVNQLAPSAPPLEAIQPSSVIDTRFIRDALRIDSSYDDIVKYSPSVSVTSPEGPGLGKNEGISIRGFQDGQFNITFDGIPFGNAAD
jgi:hypothetical protein